MPTEQPFSCARYLNLGTFRKSGNRVDTPVWFVADDTALHAFSNRDAGKVKRLRNSPRCAIAPCTFSGTPTGSWQDSTAQLVTDDREIARILALFRKKYGWQMALLDAGSTLGRRIGQRAFIRIALPPSV